MEKKRLETKVGLFVLLGVVLVAVLMIQFSKGTSVFRGTYQLMMHSRNVGDLKPRASILMSGVQIGSVSAIELAPDGRSVTIHLRIYKDYLIHDNARFVIESSGFLGDKYVAIVPNENQDGIPVLTNGAPVDCEEPFNLQEVARSAAGFIQRLDTTAKKLDDAVVDVRRYALNEQTLTNLAITIADLRATSERAISTVGDLDALIATNGPTLSHSVSNFCAFSDEIKQFGNSLGGVLETNAPGVAASVKNFEDSTAILKSILADVQAGKGLAGTVIYNEQLATNVAQIVQNLSITTSNLNRVGLWGILWSRKPLNPPAAPVLVSPKASTPH